MTRLTIVTRRETGGITIATVIAAASDTEVAALPPSSINAVKMATKAGGIIVQSARARSCSRSDAANIAAITNADSSTRREVGTDPASQGAAIATAATAARTANVSRGGTANPPRAARAGP